MTRNCTPFEDFLDKVIAFDETQGYFQPMYQLFMASYFVSNSLKWIASLFLLVSCLLWADPCLTTIAKRAEKLFYEKMYGDAIPLYSQLFIFCQEAELKTELTLRLASCYLEEGQPQITLDLLSSLETPFYLNKSLFLMSLAYRQLGQSSQALSLLQQCSLSHSHDAQNLIELEKGYHFMRLGDFENAQRAFTSILWQVNTSLPYPYKVLAQLQLAKIFLIKQQFDQALQILSLLSHQLPQEHLLNTERVYLKGLAFLAQRQEPQAALCFEELLPKALASKMGWSIQVLNGLIVSYLRQALAMGQEDLNQLKTLLSKTDFALQQLLARAPIEASYLLLTDFYLIKAKILGDLHSYIQAQRLLEKTELFSSQEGLKQALLKYAAAAPSYQERNRLYDQLLSASSHSLTLYGKVWFLKGLNDFEEGLKCLKQQEFNRVTWPFEQSAQAFSQAIQCLQTLAPAQTALSFKYLALSYAYLPEKIQQAWQVLSELMQNDTLLSTFEHPEEIHCLSAWIALHSADHDTLQKAKSLLQQDQVKGNPGPFWSERCLKLEGMICLQLGEWQQADLIFAHMLQDESYVSSYGEIWFWRAYSAEQQNLLSLKKEYLQQAYIQNPQSPYAPIAYFHFYSYREYMQGKRKAIKHLQTMPLLFPTHPLLISAYYLIGLNHKKDHFSEKGQILRRKDWTSAIDAFQLAESTFDALFEKKLIPSSDLVYFLQVRYQAQLEKAQANFTIAQNSTGGKKRIYLEYAEEIFKQIIGDFNSSQALAKKVLVQLLSPYPKVWAKAEIQLARVYEEKKEWQEAEGVLNESLEHYRQAQMAHQGYDLMRVWYAKGKLAQRQTDDEKALQYFLEAEKRGIGLSPNEKLDLWIQQSLCYKALSQFDQAMQILSRVINDDVISPLRVKAMFLRAEIYELEGRPELALKQLEATARKGGEWAQKAKEKLEQIYGY